MNIGFSIADFLKVVELVNEARKNWIDAPDEYKALKDETKALSNVLRELEDIIAETTLSTQLQASLLDAQKQCQTVLIELEAIEKKYADAVADANGFRQRSRRAWKRWRNEPSDVRNVRLRLTTSTTLLSTLYQSVNSNLLRSIHNDTSQTRKTDDDELRYDIAEWFSPATYATQFTGFVERLETGTGEWFLDSLMYKQWTESQSQTIFCPGIPGSGKSMMATIAVQDLQRRFSDDEKIAVIYLYCDYARRDQQRFTDLLGSLVRQLFQQQTFLPQQLRTLYLTARNQGLESRAFKVELQECFASLCGMYSDVYIVVDALDECRNDDLTRHYMLKLLLQQQRQHNCNFRMMATSRTIPDIVDSFIDTPQLEIEASATDIQKYLDSQMNRLICARSRYDLQKAIKDRIVEVSGPMFLLARLHFDSLVDKTKPRDVRIALSSLPKGSQALHEAYKSARERIDDLPSTHRSLAHNVLEFITYADELLTVQELQHALAIQPGMRTIDPEEDLDEETLIISLTAGLVIVDAKTRIVRLVHYTAQEYLDEVKSEWLPRGRANLGKACLRYLMMDSLVWSTEQDLLSKKLQRYPFLRHAARLWGRYAQVLTEFEMLDFVNPFFHDIDRRNLICSYIFGQLIFDKLEHFSLIHLAAFFDISILLDMCRDYWESVDKHKYQIQHPLSMAANYGVINFFRAFVTDNKNFLNSLDRRGESPSYVAAIHNQESMVEYILTHPSINISHQNSVGDSALIVDMQSESQDLATALLMKTCLNVNITNSEDASSILWTVINGDLVMFNEFLARDDIDINIIHPQYSTPLICAVRLGNKDMVEILLLRTDININQIDYLGSTALIWAVCLEKIHMVTRLLQHTDIDVNMGQPFVGKQLFCNQPWTNYETQSILEQQPWDAFLGNDVPGRPALGWAARRGSFEITKLLIAHEHIQINKADGSGATPLMLSGRECHRDVTKLLLEQDGIEINTKVNKRRKWQDGRQGG